MSSELGKGTFILFITMNIFNFLNFLFHFVMGKMLSLADYGTLAVLMSLIYIYGIPTEAIQNLISRYTSRFNVQKEHSKMKYMMYKALKKGLYVGLLIFIPAGIIGFFLSNFININFWLILVTNIYLFYAILGPIAKGVLQGRKKFSELGWNLVIESALKLFFAFSLVIFGFRVFGAIIGVLGGILAGIIFSFYFNKDLLREREKKVKFDGIYNQSIPYFVSMFVIYFMLSLDIILAKRFFSAELAGQYAVLSMLGKMIFFGTFAISKAMFPLTSEKHDNKEDAGNLFKKSIFIISIISIITVFIYWIFPELIITILYKSSYLPMAPYLVYSGLALSFLSLSNLILIHGLATNRIRKPWLLFIFLIIEVVLLYNFHNNILEYILAFMVSNIIMFIGSFFFLIKRKQERTNKKDVS